MFVQRMTPALRSTCAARPRAMQLQAIGRRMQSTSEHTTDPKTRAKLVFRFGPKDVPIELWPMGAVVIAGVTGAGFAISRHFYKDDDLRLHKSPIVGSK